MSVWDERYRDLENQNRKSLVFNFIGILLSIAGVMALFNFLNGFNESMTQVEVRWESLIISLILFPIGSYIWKKSVKLKPKNIEKNFLVFWKAYKMLEKFSERKENEDMKNAIKSVNNIKKLFSDWFTEAAPKSISTLTDPIIKNLNEKIIPLIEEKNYSEVSSFSNGCMNEAIVLYSKEIDQEFLRRFQERLDGHPEPVKKEKIEIKKRGRWQKYLTLNIFLIGIAGGIILFFTLTEMGMEKPYALAYSFGGGIALTALLVQITKKK